MSSEGGFDFSLCKRNALLESKGCHGPKHWKTGTTIAGVVYKVWHGPAHALACAEADVAGDVTTHVFSPASRRMAWFWVLTPAQQQAPQWLTRTAKRFITLHPTSTAVVPAQQQTQRQ